MTEQLGEARIKKFDAATASVASDGPHVMILGIFRYFLQVIQYLYLFYLHFYRERKDRPMG